MRFGSRCPMGLASGKRILDSLESWFHGNRFRILCQWNAYSRFQSLFAFRNPWALFWIPESRISNSTSKDFPSSISAIDILSTFLRANRLEILDRIVTWIHVNESYSDVTRDDLQRRFLARHNVATLLRHCFEWLQHCSSIVTLCYAKYRPVSTATVTKTTLKKWIRASSNFIALIPSDLSLLHNRFKCRHAKLLSTALRDDTKNGCVAD